MLKKIDRTLTPLTMMALIGLILLSGFGCNEQTRPKENQSAKPSIPAAIADTSLLPNNPKTDSTQLNQYRNGKKEGVWRDYYKNGKLKSESNYSEGIKKGVCKEWWETGKLWTEGIYVNDQANGLMKWYNDQGILVASGNMTNGKRDGAWYICDVHSLSNCITANFKMDKKVGIWKIYHDNGKLWKEQNWANGVIVYQNCWDENSVKIDCE